MLSICVKSLENSKSNFYELIFGIVGQNKTLMHQVFHLAQFPIRHKNAHTNHQKRSNLEFGEPFAIKNTNKHRHHRHSKSDHRRENGCGPRNQNGIKIHAQYRPQKRQGQNVHNAVPSLGVARKNRPSVVIEKAEPSRNGYHQKGKRGNVQWLQIIESKLNRI